MWSPRKGFGAAVANDKIFVIGGRARDYSRIDNWRLVGGVSGHRVETSRDHSTIREEVVLKNDVWSSSDQGRTWTLVNPGCEDHQQDVLLNTEVWSSNQTIKNKVGSIGSKCFLSSDCEGIAECIDLGNTNEKVCVCPMFSPRAHHTLSVQRRHSVRDDDSIFEEDVMYIVGGMSSVKQSFCADRACGLADGYQVAMDDIWMSSDGVSWTQIKPAFQESNFVGRASHTALVIPMSFGDNVTDSRDRLLIFGGETATPQEFPTAFLNDVWELPLPTEPCCKPNTPCAGDYECKPRLADFKAVRTDSEWAERSGHVTVYEPPSTMNGFQPRVYLSGGANLAKSTVFDDSWSWLVGLDDEIIWHRDFSSEGSPISALENGTFSAMDSYLSIQSPLSALKKYQLPTLELDEDFISSTHVVSPITSENDFDVMSSLNISTILDLASADLYTILKLRGFDLGRKAREVPDVCVLRELALQFMHKCELKEFTSPHFHEDDPLKELSAIKTSDVCGRGGESLPCTANDWDGCTPMQGVSVVDVHGLGNVQVPRIRHNVSNLIDELFCRQAPAGRSMGSAAFVGNKFAILGGIDGQKRELFRDVWTRDEEYPRAIITTRPASMTPQFTFSFDSNEDGAQVFEYQLFLNDEAITNWITTTASFGADVSWLDDKKGGPGKGRYSIFLRAIDPAGNRDMLFSTLTNVYQWHYVPPIPWSFVAGGIITGLASIVVGYFEYRTRRRKAILQRFALRRLKRRFKLREGMGQRRAAIADVPVSIKRPIVVSMNRGSNQHQSLRRRHDVEPGTSFATRDEDQRSRSTRSGSRTASRRSRSGSKIRADVDVSMQQGHEMKNTKEERAGDERRRRRRRNREKKRSKNLRDC